jgi:hypothetical protein
MGFGNAALAHGLFGVCAIAGSCGVLVAAADAAVAQKSPPSSCPTAAKLAGPAGTTLTRKAATKSGGTIVCSYTNSKYVNVTIDVSAVKGISTASFDAAMSIEAKALHATPKTIHGLGTAAVEYTEKDAKTNADGVASTTIAALAGDDEVLVVASLPTQHVLDIAHSLIG